MLRDLKGHHSISVIIVERKKFGKISEEINVVLIVKTVLPIYTHVLISRFEDTFLVERLTVTKINNSVSIR
jgi:hypothetical protein